MQKRMKCLGFFSSEKHCKLEIEKKNKNIFRGSWSVEVTSTLISFQCFTTEIQPCIPVCGLEILRCIALPAVIPVSLTCYGQKMTTESLSQTLDTRACSHRHLVMNLQ